MHEHFKSRLLLAVLLISIVLFTACSSKQTTSLNSNNQTERLSAVEDKITILAGNGLPEYINGTANKSAISSPVGLACDKNGKIYFADNGNNLIRSINKNNITEDYAGSIGSKDVYGNGIGGYLDTTLNSSLFCKPTDIKIVADGILVADSGNNTIRIVKSDGVYTFAGSQVSSDKLYCDGNRKTALFNKPSGITGDEFGNLYVADTGNHVIRKIDSKGNVSTVAGTPMQSGFEDGPAEKSKLCEPVGIVYKDGSIFFADSGNQRIRMLKNGEVTTIAGGGNEKYEGFDYYVGDFIDGSAKKARFNNPQYLSFGTDGSLFITDMDNSAIRCIKDGVVTTVLSADNLESDISLYLEEPCGIIALKDRIIVSDRYTNYIFSFTY